MMVVFADTFYFFALLNPKDPAHAKAVAFSQSYQGNVVTTGWVITELGDGCARPAHWRAAFNGLIADIRATARIRVVPCADELLNDGLNSTNSDQTKSGRSPIAFRLQSCTQRRLRML